MSDGAGGWWCAPSVLLQLQLLLCVSRTMSWRRAPLLGWWQGQSLRLNGRFQDLLVMLLGLLLVVMLRYGVGIHVRVGMLKRCVRCRCGLWGLPWVYLHHGRMR